MAVKNRRFFSMKDFLRKILEIT